MAPLTHPRQCGGQHSITMYAMSQPRGPGRKTLHEGLNNSSSENSKQMRHVVASTWHILYWYNCLLGPRHST